MADLYFTEFTDTMIEELLGFINKEASDGTDLPANTGAMTATMDGGYKKITPAGACIFNATAGSAGQRCTFIVTTSGTTSYTLTFGTNFISQGVLATGTVSGKIFTVSFIFDGTNWIETARTAAM
jgi:hypothetical protein